MRTLIHSPFAALILTIGILGSASASVTASPAVSSLALRIAQDDQDRKKDAPKPKLDLAALKARMKSRFRDLSRLRDAGIVGETFDGLVAVRNPADAKKLLDPKNKERGTIGDLLSAEVADRRALYAHLAKELKVPADKIGKQNGIRNLNKAKPEHWFRLAGGKWAQRKSIVKKTK